MSKECQEYFVHTDAMVVNECSLKRKNCNAYTLHKERAKQTRAAYRSDAELTHSDSNSKRRPAKCHYASKNAYLMENLLPFA